MNNHRSIFIACLSAWMLQAHACKARAEFPFIPNSSSRNVNLDPKIANYTLEITPQSFFDAVKANDINCVSHFCEKNKTTIC